RCARKRDGRGVYRRHPAARRRHDPGRDRQRTHHRGRRSPNVGGAEVVRVRAVVFDLWETLIDWDREANAQLNEDLHALIGGEFRERWNGSTAKYNGPIRT